MGRGKKHTLRFDPRTELLLLVLANIVAFTQHDLWVEITWVVFLLLLIVACGCQKSAGKLAIALGFVWRCNTMYSKRAENFRPAASRSLYLMQERFSLV